MEGILFRHNKNEMLSLEVMKMELEVVILMEINYTVENIPAHIGIE